MTVLRVLLVAAWIAGAVAAAIDVASPYRATLLLAAPQRITWSGGEAQLESVVSARFNTSGQFVFLAQYTRAAAGVLRTGLFQFQGDGMVPMLLEDQQTALAGSQGFGNLRGLLMNEAGAIVLTARRVDGGTGRDVILRIEGGELRVLAAEGQRRPGGGAFGSVLATGLNQRGDVVFESGGVYLWTTAGGDVPVALAGDPAPGTGEVWTRAGPAVLNDAGQIAFTGEYLRQGVAASGVWLYDAGEARVIARSGDFVPGYFPQTLATLANPAISTVGVVAFAATTAGRLATRPAGFGGRGVFVASPDGPLSIAPAGATLADSGAFAYDELPSLAFDAAEQLYWSDRLLADASRTPVVARRNALTGVSLFASADSGGRLTTPDMGPSGLMILGSTSAGSPAAKQLHVLSTIVLTSAADPSRATVRLPPGAIATAFLPDNASGSASAAALPLPTMLSGARIAVGDRLAPLFYAGSNQVNFQVPAGTSGAALVQLIRDASIAGSALLLAQPCPSLFTVSQAGSGQAVALNQDGSLNRSIAPADRGSIVQLFGTGAGGRYVDRFSVTLALPDGQPAPATGVPLYYTAARPFVWISGQPADVYFSGLAPGLVGVWQLNVIVPRSAATGPAAPVRIIFDGVEANAVTLAIR